MICVRDAETGHYCLSCIIDWMANIAIQSPVTNLKFRNASISVTMVMNVNPFVCPRRHGFIDNLPAKVT